VKEMLSGVNLLLKIKVNTWDYSGMQHRQDAQIQNDSICESMILMETILGSAILSMEIGVSASLDCSWFGLIKCAKLPFDFACYLRTNSSFLVRIYKLFF